MKKILFVVTSHGEMGNSGRKTGFYLPELAHPYNVLSKKGFAIDIASPKSGAAPIDGMDQADETSRAFLEKHSKEIKNTKGLSDVKASDYAAVLLVGGHGTMWDFPDNASLAGLIRSIYENGGVVAAVCHGPAGLVNVKLADGKYIVSGKNVTGFTNGEEKEIKLDSVVPFLLESRLTQDGAKFKQAPNWQVNVVVDGRLVTGQNPASAEGVGTEVAKLLSR